MADPQKTSSFYNKTASNSLDIEGGPSQNEFIKQDSSAIGATRSLSRHLSTETNKNLSVGGDSRHSQNFNNLKLQVSYRLRRRNELLHLRRRITDYSFAVALLGIVLMIIENELTSELSSKSHKVSLFLMKTMQKTKQNSPSPSP